MVYIHTMEYYLTIKKRMNFFSICCNMDDLEGIILSSISQRKMNTV